MRQESRVKKRLDLLDVRKVQAFRVYGFMKKL